jgi:hypothetical protein
MLQRVKLGSVSDLQRSIQFLLFLSLHIFQKLQASADACEKQQLIYEHR